MNFEEIQRTGIHAVVTRTEIDYKRPARLGEILRVEGRVTEYQKSSALASVHDDEL